MQALCVGVRNFCQCPEGQSTCFFAVMCFLADPLLLAYCQILQQGRQTACDYTREGARALAIEADWGCGKH